jgi:hypothetical protein
MRPMIISAEIRKNVGYQKDKAYKGINTNRRFVNRVLLSF